MESANFACICITSEREIVSALNVQKHINTMYNYIPIIELDYTVHAETHTCTSSWVAWLWYIANL